MRKIAVAVLAILGLVVIATPASASYNAGCDGYVNFEPPAEQALCYPVPAGSEVVIQGDRNLWGMRVFAEYMDLQLSGLEIHTEQGAMCEDYPGAYCVVVSKEYLPSGPLGTWFFFGEDLRGKLMLNTSYAWMPRDVKRYVAAHEFMHVLGMAHHDGVDGLLTTTTQTVIRPSASELSTLQGWYGNGQQE